MKKLLLLSSVIALFGVCTSAFASPKDDSNATAFLNALELKGQLPIAQALNNDRPVVGWFIKNIKLNDKISDKKFNKIIKKFTKKTNSNLSYSNYSETGLSHQPIAIVNEPLVYLNDNGKYVLNDKFSKILPKYKSNGEVRINENGISPTIIQMKINGIDIADSDKGKILKDSITTISNTRGIVLKSYTYGNGYVHTNLFLKNALKGKNEISDATKFANQNEVQVDVVGFQDAKIITGAYNLPQDGTILIKVDDNNILLLKPIKTNILPSKVTFPPLNENCIPPLPPHLMTKMGLKMDPIDNYHRMPPSHNCCMPPPPMPLRNIMVGNPGNPGISPPAGSFNFAINANDLLSNHSQNVGWHEHCCMPPPPKYCFGNHFGNHHNHYKHKLIKAKQHNLNK